jgi:hypothetical protein
MVAKMKAGWGGGAGSVMAKGIKTFQLDVMQSWLENNCLHFSQKQQQHAKKGCSAAATYNRRMAAQQQKKG